MNALADKHHAGLYHSLQLLAKRLGWTLYTPTGHEWWDEWYWSFGRSTYGDDRLARQFLGWTDEDPEFPGVPINYVTLEEAQTMDWTYVIATVPDNEAGFHKFAQEHGAQYVVQAGNTNQAIDWSRDPIVLSSSEMPIRGRGLVHHQEMDPIAYSPPVSRRIAASFVNCMPDMGRIIPGGPAPNWDMLREAQSLGLPIAVYGIDGPEGVVKPYSALLERMASVGWGWHDKAQGDGFGHVIHSWAAIGRPLIGHASYYRGKMGEHFWRDGETCIDLDQHSIAFAVDQATRMAPEWHELMCRAIRAEFEKINYAAEAAQIADLLGVAVPA